MSALFEFVVHAVAYGSSLFFLAKSFVGALEERNTPRTAALNVLHAHLLEFPELWVLERGVRSSDHTLGYNGNRIVFDFKGLTFNSATVNGERVPCSKAKKLLDASQRHGGEHKKLIESLRYSATALNKKSLS